MNWELIALALACLAFVVIGCRSWGGDSVIPIMNYAIALGFAIQFAWFFYSYSAEKEAASYVSSIDLKCNQEQIKQLEKVKFTKKEPLYNGWGRKKLVEVLDDEKVNERLVNLSELIICLNSELISANQTIAKLESHNKPKQKDK